MSARLLNVGDILVQRYEVLRYLDEGGMQQVFEARDIAFSRTVALKAPKNNSAAKRFDRSARLSARITHANIAKTLDYFEVEGNSYLIEELIPGTDLEKVLTSDLQCLDPHLLAHLVHRMAKGLSAAHHASVFHRDLKPSNVMVSDVKNLSSVVITDFGIARMAAQELEEAAEQGVLSLSNSQTAMGTLPYMAPEMIETPRQAGLPADIWAIGAITYRLLTGELPFGSGLKAVTAIMSATIPAPQQKPRIDSSYYMLWNDLWSIVEKCLRKDPSERISADELLNLCSNLCYSDAPRHFGVVESVRPGTGRWGFIRDLDGGSSIFYHEDSVFGRMPKEGSRVLYAVSPGNPNDRAFPLICLKDSA